jgi:hypothetical protein
MRPRKYPLDLLARLRAKEVDDATQLLADAIRARQEAQRREGLAVAQRDGAEAAARLVGAGERGALERGELRAADLARAATWEAGVAAERAELGDRLAKALSRTHMAQGREGQAQDGVARARADAELVARDRARWDDEVRRKDEAGEEEAADEAFRGKRA